MAGKSGSAGGRDELQRQRGVRLQRQLPRPMWDQRRLGRMETWVAVAAPLVVVVVLSGLAFAAGGSWSEVGLAVPFGAVMAPLLWFRFERPRNPSDPGSGAV